MRRLALSLVALALAAGTAGAQKRANTRSGFWIGFGVGSGALRTDCSTCNSDPVSGGSGNLRMGGTLNDRWLLGGEVNTWAHSENGVAKTNAYVSFVAQFYPKAAGAFYLKLGVGGMSQLITDGTYDITSTGPSVILGLGYDFRLGTNFSLSPYINSMAAGNIKMQYNGQAMTPSDGLTIALAQVGVSFNWH